MNAKSLKVLLIGSGGREHAMAWKIGQSKLLEELIVAPGNDAMGCESWSVSLSQDHFEELAEQALSQEIDLCVVGPDNPLADGIVDVFEKKGMACFGPSASASQIESSKSFSKDVMNAAGVPTARYEVFNDQKKAESFLKEKDWSQSGWVIKADGLALGKGVIVCDSLQDSLNALDSLFSHSGKVVIEEKCVGDELSWMAICSDEEIRMLEPARDYKPIGEGNTGPNTGGMGSYSPVKEVLNDEFKEKIKNEIFLPTLKELKKRGCPFKGVLYAGLMVDLKADRLWTLEFNARFGDPETQVLLPRMESDFLEIAYHCATGKLSDCPEIEFKKQSAVFVVGATPGYPKSSTKGLEIQGPLLDQSSDVHYFCAGVKKQGDRLVTSGGRVFGALGMGESLEEARNLSYERLSQVSFEGMQFRKDIAK